MSPGSKRAGALLLFALALVALLGVILPTPNGEALFGAAVVDYNR